MDISSCRPCMVCLRAPLCCTAGHLPRHGKHCYSAALGSRPQRASSMVRCLCHAATASPQLPCGPPGTCCLQLVRRCSLQAEASAILRQRLRSALQALQERCMSTCSVPQAGPFAQLSPGLRMAWLQQVKLSTDMCSPPLAQRCQSLPLRCTPMAWFLPSRPPEHAYLRWHLPWWQLVRKCTCSSSYPSARLLGLVAQLPGTG
mmetsp:Transcript_5600/g.10516  ORF Transcript_5600/g.10516 Transcript_5600/m.10516 type:complete len:203 (+) Transcript_5600:826-1434(+)